jgi:hypothetical protein
MTSTPATSTAPGASPAGVERLLIVTAADQAYWRCLHQFLRSAQRRRLQVRHDFLAYDLGLEASTRLQLQSRFPWCGFRRFRFETHPPHIGRELRGCPWKPFLIQEVMQSRRGLVLWLDSATLFKQALDDVVAQIRRLGVYGLRGQSALGSHCDADILDALSVPIEIRQRPERAGGILGFDASNPAAHKLVATWCEYHLVPDLVRTVSTTHKSDQALLSIAMGLMEARGELTLGDDEIDISSQHPVRWMTSRNKVPPWLPPWLDPAVRAYYAAYKVADRANLRWRHRLTNLANGLNRLKREHFSVFVASASTGKVVAIKAPPLSYYADPFIWRHRERTYLLCEEFRYARHKGYLRCIPLDADLKAGAPQTIIPRAGHASFPFLFEDGGSLYLVPETSADGGVHLYRCEDFPQRWTQVRSLLPAIDAADTIVLRHDHLWWLITSIRTRPDGGARHLAVFFTDNLLTGTWRPHPVNASKLYGESPFGSGRNAGAIIRSGERLLRPTQHNPNYYGEAVRWMEIERLTPTEYRECELAGAHPLARLSARLSMHHLTIHDDLIAWDVRDRVGPECTLSPRAKKSHSLLASGLDRLTTQALLSL